MDSMDECPSASRIISMEMSAFSRASFLHKSEGFCVENQGAEAAELCSQILCSSLSLVDPLCSIVPCSISCNEGPPSQAPECKQSKGEEEEFMNPKESPMKQDLEREAGPSFTPLVKGINAINASTAKFLYGCAVNSWIMNPNWLFDSLQAGVMLHLESGNLLASTTYSEHGGGQVFVSLQGLVQNLKDISSSHGIILVANEASTSRHLSNCGLEHDVKTVDPLFASVFNSAL